VARRCALIEVALASGPWKSLRQDSLCGIAGRLLAETRANVVGEGVIVRTMNFKEGAIGSLGLLLGAAIQLGCSAGPVEGTDVGQVSQSASRCRTGYADCNANSADGCETNISASITNCGACGNVCSTSNASAQCKSGQCQLTCKTGYGNCDSAAGNGCEVNTRTSPTNCGACGKVCPNGVACVAGVCKSSTCQPGFADCDSNTSNGCEVNTQTSTTNCGVCGNFCIAANGTSSCVGGTCQIAACNAGFGNCDSSAANGCEVNLQNSPSNCGACGNVCLSGACVGGVCS
jgi:hypothetical protein